MNYQERNKLEKKIGKILFPYFLEIKANLAEAELNVSLGEFDEVKDCFIKITYCMRDMEEVIEEEYWKSFSSEKGETEL
jgi:hypothetical protein